MIILIMVILLSTYLITYTLVYLFGHFVIINLLIHSLAPLGVLEFNKVDERLMNASRRLTSSSNISQYALNTGLTVLYDPPSGFHSPSALGVYVEASNRDAKIYYEIDGMTLIHLHFNCLLTLLLTHSRLYRYIRWCNSNP